MPATMTFTATVQRKEPFLPRYIVIAPEHTAGRTRTFAAEVWLNGTGPFARNLHPWGKGSADFFFNLTEPQCRKAGLETGAVCTVTVLPAS